MRAALTPGFFGRAAAAAGGGFPVVEATSTGGSAGAASHSITMPSGVAVGNLIAIIFASDSTTAPTVGSGTGWSLLGTITNSGNSHTLEVFWKIADGSDALTVNTANDQVEYIVYRISGATALSGTGSFIATTNNPPAHTPAGGSKKYLWILGFGISASGDLTTPPSGYGNTINVNISGSGTSAFSCRAQIEAASEDPGTFTPSASNSICAYTIAVAP